MKRNRIGRRKNGWLVIGLAAAVSLPAAPARPAGADVLYVDDSAPPPPTGANDGSSWDNAFIDLQDALAIAQSGDEIRIAQGVYAPAEPGGPREATFNLVDGMILQGGYAGFGAIDPDALDSAEFTTILSGDLNSDDLPSWMSTDPDDHCYHVLMADGVGPATHVRGVMVMGGRADDSDSPHDRGGGLLCLQRATPTITQCTFQWCVARNGGGGIFAEDAALLVEHCLFFQNYVMGSAGYGAGIACEGPTVVHACVFESNCAFDDGPGVGGPAIILDCLFLENVGDDGGAIRSALLAANCDFIGNWAGFWGGAAYQVSVLLNCRFHDNRAEEGGAVRNAAVIANCLFTGNSAWGVGGAVALTPSASAVTLTNCTFVGNVAAAGGGVSSASSALTLRNCILWENTGDEGSTVQDEQVAVFVGAADVSHCTIEGWDGSLGGLGNNGLDPLMIDADGTDDIFGSVDDNPRLSADSPARDSGDTSALPFDEFDLDADGEMTEALPLDLDGRRRVVGPAVDRGAFEFQTCLADYLPAADQGDGEVNVEELIEVIASWGPCLQPCPPVFGCPADIVPNCAVDVDDLIAVILGWGACD